MNTNPCFLTLVPAVLLGLTGTLPGQSLYARAVKARTYRGLIHDHTAHAIGDILTIVIREEHKVKQEDKTDRSSSSSLAASLESFDVKTDAFRAGILPDFDIRSSRAQKGQAKQERDQIFEARMAVTVQDVLPNGNLIVVGRRTIIIDDEDKTLKISGIIRKIDIAADNTIASNMVAEAKVAILGDGKNTESITKGPVGRIVETAFWFVWPF